MKYKALSYFILLLVLINFAWFAYLKTTGQQ